MSLSHFKPGDKVDRDALKTWASLLKQQASAVLADCDVDEAYGSDVTALRHAAYKNRWLAEGALAALNGEIPQWEARTRTDQITTALASMTDSELADLGLGRIVKL